MPDPYERHSRSRWEWGTPGARSQGRAAAAQEQLVPDIIREGKRPPGKKDPNLCKGQHWKGSHTLEPVINVNGWRSKKECGWGISWVWGDCKPVWYCCHELICSGCGKNPGKSPECPLYHEITTAEQAFLDEEIRKSQERHAAWRLRRKPVINGPQGYRKKR
jgi:hypothetical protein